MFVFWDNSAGSYKYFHPLNAFCAASDFNRKAFYAGFTRWLLNVFHTNWINIFFISPAIGFNLFTKLTQLQNIFNESFTAHRVLCFGWRNAAALKAYSQTFSLAARAKIAGAFIVFKVLFTRDCSHSRFIHNKKKRAAREFQEDGEKSAFPPSLSGEKYNSNIFADNTQQFLQLFWDETQKSYRRMGENKIFSVFF